MGALAGKCLTGQLELNPPGDSGRQSGAIPPSGQLCWGFIISTFQSLVRAAPGGC